MRHRLFKNILDVNLIRWASLCPPRLDKTCAWKPTLLRTLVVRSGVSPERGADYGHNCWATTKLSTCSPPLPKSTLTCVPPISQDELGKVGV